MKYYFDAIVVGSGISGGWAAKELCESGLKVLLLDRGKNIEHIKDYVHATRPPWSYSHRGTRTRKLIEEYPVLQRSYPLNEVNPDWWASDQESPYTEVKRFDWFRGYHVGGRSLMWGKQSYRLSSFDFEANAIEGVAVAWPVSYDEIAPWYDYVEKFAGISGSLEGLPQLPDGKFLPPMEMTCVEKDVSRRIKEYYHNSRMMIIGRAAHVTGPLAGRELCQYRNKCWVGCPFGGYFSTQSSTLPAAAKTDNLTLRPYSIVKQLLFDKDKKRATGVEVLDAESNETYQFKSKIIFLNASALNSTWVLMNSATNVWPLGLGSSSGELGHNLMDHHSHVGAWGLAEGYEDKYYYGNRPNNIYIPRYRNLFDDRRDYLRGFGYQGAASRQDWKRNIAELSIGLALKEELSEPGPWTMGIGAFGEMLPYHDNKVTLDKSKKDKWGLPVLAIDCEIKDNERSMRKDMLNDAVEMLEIAGIKNVKGNIGESVPGSTIHEMGTARMGKSPKSSVLNKYNQVWDAPNVFVTDGAFMTSSACQNPSLTYMAFTARAAHYAVTELKRMNL